MYFSDRRTLKRVTVRNSGRGDVASLGDVHTSGYRKYEATTGFRDNDHLGEPIDPRVIDPYGYFLEAVSRQRRESNQIQPGDAVIDDGHPFYRVEHWMDFNYMTGLYKPANLSKPSGLRYGGPFTPGTAWRLPSEGELLFPMKKVTIGGDGRPVYSAATEAANSFPALAVDGSQAIGQKWFEESVLNAPEWNGLTSLSELREGLPRIPGSFMNGRNPLWYHGQTDGLRAALASHRGDFGTKIWLKRTGQELTNVNLGWMPLVGDVMAFAKALAWTDTRLLQLQRASGRPVRRKRSTPWNTETRRFNGLSTSGSGLVTSIPPLLQRERFNGSTNHNVGLGYSPSASLIQEESWRAWYSASFSYRYTGPVMPDFSERVRYLFRPDLTLGQLYAAAPWSWLVDWFLHLETTIMSNQLIADTNLIQNYGYVMTERQRRSTVDVDTGSYGNAPKWQPVIPPLSITFGTTEKRRVRGNPFGFNVRLDNLTIRQLGILGNLSLAKL